MKCRTSTPIEVEVQPGEGGVQMLRQLADAIETTLAGDQGDTDEDLPPVVELPFVPRRLDLPTLEALADALDSVEADDEAPAVEQLLKPAIWS